MIQSSPGSPMSPSVPSSRTILACMPAVRRPTDSSTGLYPGMQFSRIVKIIAEACGNLLRYESPQTRGIKEHEPIRTKHNLGSSANSPWIGILPAVLEAKTPLRLLRFQRYWYPSSPTPENSPVGGSSTARAVSLLPSILTWTTRYSQQKGHHTVKSKDVLWNKLQSELHVPFWCDDESALNRERTETEPGQPVAVVKWHADQCNRNIGGSRGLGGKFMTLVSVNTVRSCSGRH